MKSQITCRSQIGVQSRAMGHKVNPELNPEYGTECKIWMEGVWRRQYKDNDVNRELISRCQFYLTHRKAIELHTKNNDQLRINQSLSCRDSKRKNFRAG